MRIRKILTVALLTAATACIALMFAAPDVFAQTKAPTGAPAVAAVAPGKSAVLQDVWFDIKLNAIDKEIGYANLLIEETICKLTETSEEEPALRFKWLVVLNSPAGDMAAGETLFNMIYFKKDLTFFSATVSASLKDGKSLRYTYERKGDKLRMLSEEAAPADMQIKSWEFYPEWLGAWLFTKKQMKVGDKVDIRFFTPMEGFQTAISDGQITVMGAGNVGEIECMDVIMTVKIGAKERTAALKVNNREGWQQLMQNESLTWRNAPKEKFEKGRFFEAKGRKSPMLPPLLKKDKMVKSPGPGNTGPKGPGPKGPGLTGPSAAELIAARDKLTGMVEDIKKLMAAKKDMEANKLTSDFVNQWTLWADVGDDAHKETMKKLWDDFIKFRPLPDIALADATVFYGKIEQLVNDTTFVDNFKAVYAPVARWVEEIKKRAVDKVVEGTEQQKKIRELAEKADKLSKTVQTRIEFETKKPKITGIIYMTKDVEIPLILEFRLLGRTIPQTTVVRVPQSSSIAIINDRTFADGDSLDKYDEDNKENKENIPTIIRIESDGVRFRYKGEEVKTGF